MFKKKSKTKYKANNKLTARKVIICLLSICLCWSLFEIYRGLNIYRQIDKLDKEIYEEAVQEDENESDFDKKALSRVIDFDALKKKNEDVIGWIYVPNTPIDEVIMQGDENMTYLYHDINKDYLTAGQVFCDASNSAFEDQYTILYGHNMYNGSRFAGVRQIFLLGKKKWNAFENIYIYTPDNKITVYRVFAADEILNTDKLYSTETAASLSEDVNQTVIINTSAAAMSKRIEYIKSNAKYSRDIIYSDGLTENNLKIIMLSTCAGAETDWRDCVFGYQYSQYQMGYTD